MFMACHRIISTIGDSFGFHVWIFCVFKQLLKAPYETCDIAVGCGTISLRQVDQAPENNSKVWKCMPLPSFDTDFFFLVCHLFRIHVSWTHIATQMCLTIQHFNVNIMKVCFIVHSICFEIFFSRSFYFIRSFIINWLLSETKHFFVPCFLIEKKRKKQPKHCHVLNAWRKKNAI